jgi:hypothetical protein
VPGRLCGSDVEAIFRHIDSAKREHSHLRTPSLLMRARAQATVRPANPPTQSVIADLQGAARKLGLQLVVVDVRTDSDLEAAFTTFSQQRVGAVLVGTSAFFIRRMEQLAARAARHRLPARRRRGSAGVPRRQPPAQ